MGNKGIFVAATGQNVGKTTICLGLIAALKKKINNLGFIKPIGQQHVTVENGLQVDKDVVLFKEYFNIPIPYSLMSPVIVPTGFTKKFLDGLETVSSLRKRILDSFSTISSTHDYTIAEGTGHVGVGSIIELNNATVAKALNLDAILIATGGIGSAFDELALNKSLFDQHGVKIKGIILNSVLPEKREMVIDYMTKALKRWEIPLIGCIPFNTLLSTPSFEDFKILFEAQLLAGERFSHLHFTTIRLVASSVDTFWEVAFPNQLIITPATREDVILAVIDKHGIRKEKNSSPDCALILTGLHAPSYRLIEKLKQAEIPTFYAAKTSFDVTRLITSFTAKIRKEDVSKVEEAINLVHEYVDCTHL